VEVVDESFSFCPFAGTPITFEVTGPDTIRNTLYTSNLSSNGQVANFASGLGTLRASPGEEVCLEVTAPNWTGDGRVCRRIEVGISRLDFAAGLSRGGGCRFALTLAAQVITFDPSAFCNASCARLQDCGRPDTGCVENCVQDLANTEEDAVCFDATRRWLGCLHSAPCVNEPEYFCSANSSGFSEEAQLFSSGQCTRPLPPPPPTPDPLACDPRQSELVAGTIGDFAVVARTSDFPDQHYLIFDLSQLDEVDATLAASPGDPLLATARSVVPRVRGLDGTARDQCSQPGIVAIRFELDPRIATSAYARIDGQLGDLQSRLEELTTLAGEVKRQAVAFVFDQVLCPATGQLFSLFPPPANLIAGTAAQAAIGCFN